MQYRVCDMLLQYQCHSFEKLRATSYTCPPLYRSYLSLEIYHQVNTSYAQFLLNSTSSEIQAINRSTSTPRLFCLTFSLSNLCLYIAVPISFCLSFYRQQQEWHAPAQSVLTLSDNPQFQTYTFRFLA